MLAISRRPELDDSSRSHFSPQSLQALGSRIIPGPWNNNCCRLLSDTYLPEHSNGCRHAVAQWGTMAYPRQGGRAGWVAPTQCGIQADVGSPLHSHSVRATPWDHLRCNHITCLDRSIANMRSAPASRLGFMQKAGYGRGRPVSVPGQGGCFAGRGLPGDWLLFNVKVTSETASAMCRIWPQGLARHTDSLSMIDITVFPLRYCSWEAVRMWKSGPGSWVKRLYRCESVHLRCTNELSL